MEVYPLTLTMPVSLDSLVAEVERYENVKDHWVSRPAKRKPDIIFFGVDPDKRGDNFVEALRSQNSALDKA